MDKIDENFKVFHEENPHVYDLFRKYTFILFERGHPHAGAKAIFERMRWDLMLKTSPGKPVTLNNNYTSRYARLLEENEPELRGFFRKRKLHEDNVDSVKHAEEPYL
jgi:hypothetical protein